MLCSGPSNASCFFLHSPLFSALFLMLWFGHVSAHLPCSYSLVSFKSGLLIRAELKGVEGDGSSEITCLFWSQPHRHWKEDLEPLCHHCICPVSSPALHSARIPPMEALWDVLMSSSNIQRTRLNKNSSCQLLHMCGHFGKARKGL